MNPMVTYLNTDNPDYKKVEAEFGCIWERNEVIRFGFGNQIDFMDNSLSTQRWLRKIGRYDLVRPLDAPSKD